MCDLIVRLLPAVLPAGGVGFFVIAAKHRDGSPVLRVQGLGFGV
jgi:hypothetical protein